MFSYLGYGTKEPITHDLALTLFGFKQPFEEIKFGPFTGNKTILAWFKNLCAYFGVKGDAKIFFKVRGKKHKTG